jgi:hypothetical protein
MLLALLIGIGVLLCSLLCYAMATDIIVHLIVRVLPRDHGVLGFWKGVAFMMLVTLITAVTHLFEIALWAIVFLLCGEMKEFETAFYFSAVNYTALGYGDIVLPDQWRLLGPIEAINGLLLFGISTAVMFAVLNRLISNRLRHQHGHRSEGLEPASGSSPGEASEELTGLPEPGGQEIRDKSVKEE